MEGIFIVLITIVSILLALVVLVQSPKGSALGSAFGGSGAAMMGGVKRTTEFFDRATWALAGALCVLVLAMNLMIGGGGDAELIEDSGLEGTVNEAPVPQFDGGLDLSGGTEGETDVLITE